MPGITRWNDEGHISSLEEATDGECVAYSDYALLLAVLKRVIGKYPNASCIEALRPDKGLGYRKYPGDPMSDKEITEVLDLIADVEHVICALCGPVYIIRAMATEDVRHAIKEEMKRLDFMLRILDTGLPVDAPPTLAPARPDPPATLPAAKPKRKMSPKNYKAYMASVAKRAASRAKTMAARNATLPPEVPQPAKKKNNLTPAGRKILSEAAKKRWKAKKKAGLAGGKLPSAKALATK